MVFELDKLNINKGVIGQNNPITLSQPTSGTDKLSSELSVSGATKSEEERKKSFCARLGITIEELERYEAMPEFKTLSDDKEKEDFILNDLLEKTSSPTVTSDTTEPKIKFPDNWKQMSAQEQQDFLFEEMGRVKYSDWDTKSQEEKEQLKLEGIEQLCQSVDPQYVYMSAKDQTKAQELARVVIGAVIDNVDIKKVENGEIEIDPIAIYGALKNENQIQVGTVLRAKADELGIKISKNDEIRQQETASVREYFQSVGKAIPQNSRISGAQRLEYYRHLKNTNVELNEYQQRELEVLEELERIDPGQLNNDRVLQKGTTTINEIFGNLISDDKQFITTDDGSLSLQRGADTNRELLLEALKSKYSNISSLADDSPELQQIQDEFRQIYFNLSSYEQKVLLNTILRDDSDNQIDKRLFNGIQRNSSAMMVSASNDANVSVENQKYAIRTHNASLKARKADGENIEVSGYTDYVAQSKNFSSDVKAVVGVGMAELGEKEMDAFLQSEKEYDENYMETFRLTNKGIYESDDVTDAMKEYYASRSIEILDNPDERNVQANDLRSYDTEYYNRGIETGYANASYNNDYNSSQNQELTSQQIVEQLSNMTPQEKEAYAEKYNLSPSICNELPELVEYYVNKGDGMYVVKNCSVPIGNTAIRLMLKNPEDRKQLAALQPGRLSAATQAWLEESGVVKPSTGSSGMGTYKA